MTVSAEARGQVPRKQEGEERFMPAPTFVWISRRQRDRVLAFGREVTTVDTKLEVIAILK